MSKAKRVPDDPNPICAFCGLPKALHRLTNYADGPYVSAETLVCPTACFATSKEAKKLLKKRAVK